MGVSNLATSKSAHGWYMYIRHFTNKKGARAKRHPAIEGFPRKGALEKTLIVNSQKRPFSKKPFNIVSGIVTADVPIVCWSFFFAVFSNRPISLCES